ncbi:MAG: hypothetical protein IJY12_00840 [Clostridia bacterium]|nr:hypothetical protein [Clostridia bacterium]
MTTGSVDPADYSQEPGLLRLIPLSTVQERGGYLSLMDLFDFSDESLDVEVFVLLGEPTGIRYIYYFEHATILVDTTEAKSASEYLMAQKNSQTVSGITSIQSPAQSVELSNGYVSYTDGDFEVIYGYQQNEKVSALFVLDGFSVQIGITKGITPAEDVRSFLNDSSYSKLHPLFSTDEQVLTSALNEIRGNLSKADLPTE